MTGANRAERCPACGASHPADAARCPGCGLVLAPESDGGDGPVRPPEHVGVILGATPAVCAVTGSAFDIDAGTDDEVRAFEAEVPVERPGPPAPRRRHRARWIALGVVVVVALAVAAAWALSRPSARSRAFEVWMAAAALDPVPEPPLFDADARLRAIEAQFPDAAASEAPVLPPAGTVSVHEFADAFVAATADADPWTALALGRHPHPIVPRESDFSEMLPGLRIQRAALREIERWPTAGLSVHDRLDLRLLRMSCEQALRTGAGSDRDALLWIDGALEWLTWIRDIRCCPADERAKAAVAIATAIPDFLDDSVAWLRRPAAPTVRAAASRLESDIPWIASYESTWDGIDAETRARIREACGPLQTAALRCVTRLRTEVLPRADGPLGIGREEYAAILRGHGFDPDVRALYGRALAALREHDAAVASASSLPMGRRAPRNADDIVAALRGSIDRWLPSAPPEPGLGIARPRASADRRASALYIVPGPLAGTPPAILQISDLPATGDEAEREVARLRQVHTLAHEAYPGHRMDALAGRGSCIVRRAFADDGATEGWATYAEDLIHETGHCAGGALDAWVRACDGAWLAESVMLEILCATGAAGPAELTALVHGRSDAGPDEELVGDIALHQGRNVAYFEGNAAIRRLRESERRRVGARFPVREFHSRFLTEGPIPVPWMAEAWGAER